MSKKYLRIIIAGMLLMLGLGVPINGLASFFKPVTEATGFSVSQFSLVGSFLNLTGIVAVPLVTKFLLPKIGLRKTAILGGVFGALGFFLLANGKSLLSFYSAAVVIGLFMMSSTAIVAVTLVNNWFRKSHGLVMGLVAATIGLSTAITSAVVPAFIQNYGWEKGFLLLGGMYAVALFLGAFLLIEKPSDVGMLPYGVTKESIAAEADDASTVVIKHKDTDMTYAQALRSPVFYLLALSFVCFAMISTFTQQIPIFFTTKGASAVQAGMILSIASIVMIASKIVMGIASDKLGATKAFYIFTTVYILAFCIFAATDNVTFLIGGAMIYAVSTGVPAVMNQLVTFDVLGKKEFTAIWGILSTANSLGLAMGGPLLGYFYDATGSYNTTIIVCIVFMVVCLASFFFAVMLRQRVLKKTYELKEA